MLVEFLAQFGAIVRFVTEHAFGAHHSTDQTLRKRTVVRFTSAQQDGDQAPFSICECMDLRIQPLVAQQRVEHRAAVGRQHQPARAVAVSRYGKDAYDYYD
jgi:hypothetical protein